MPSKKWFSWSASRKKKKIEFSIWVVHKADSHKKNSTANLPAKLALHMHKLFVYMLKLNWALTKVQIQANLLGIQSCVNLSLYVLNRWMIILLMILQREKIKTKHFSNWSTQKNWKIIRLIGGLKQRIFLMSALWLMPEKFLVKIGPRVLNVMTC